MKIKEQDSQHLVIVPTSSERFWGVLFLVFAIIFISISISLFLTAPSFSDIGCLVVTIVFLYFGGQMFSRRVIFNKPIDSIILEARLFMLIRKKRITPLSAVTGVKIESKVNPRLLFTGRGDSPIYSSEVSIEVGDKRIKIDSSSNERNMRDLASQIRHFIGTERLERAEELRWKKH